MVTVVGHFYSSPLIFDSPVYSALDAPPSPLFLGIVVEVELVFRGIILQMELTRAREFLNWLIDLREILNRVVLQFLILLLYFQIKLLLSSLFVGYGFFRLSPRQGG